jgi:hypothetical protein
MNRRNVLAVSMAAPFVAAEGVKQQYYELRQYQLRNGYSKRVLPAKPAGAGPMGVFTPVIAEGTPFVTVLTIHASLADIEGAPDLDFDYVRYDRTILRAFSGMPELKAPPAAKAPHIFEMRTYESDNAATLRKKIEMFNGGEMQIFQRLGMNPVFFGEALAGSKLPHLTYMLAYEDLAARDRLWKEFGADPAWLKLRATPGLSDADIVSNISNSILRPASISDIR